MISRRSFLAVTGGNVAVAGAGCVSGTDSPSEDVTEWTEGTPMPTAQSNTGHGVIDGRLYCFGGIRSGQQLDATADGVVFDPSDGDGGSWSSIPDMPKPLWGQCGVSDGERIFAFGGAPPDSPYSTGLPPTDEILVFEPGEGWTNLTSTAGVRCPYRTWVMQGVYNPHDGLIYNVGGAMYGRNTNAEEFDAVWTFDPERERVVDAPLTTLPTKRRWATVGLVEVDGLPMLHVIAGQSDRPEDANDRYDIEADEWRAATPVPESGSYGTNFDPVIDNTIYLTHGLQWEAGETLTNDHYARICWGYDPVEDEWNTDLPEPGRDRTGGAAEGVIDGTLYVAGGHTKDYDGDHYHEAMSHVESFTP